MPWRCTALKELDDDHAAATAWYLYAIVIARFARASHDGDRT
jgi:hypothetical protein